MSHRPRWLAAVATILSLLLAAFVWESRREPRTLRLRRFRVHLPGISADLAGARIAFLTDFHVNGPGYGDTLAPLALDLAAQEHPDLTLLGGDYVDHGRWEGNACVFDRLRAIPSVFGVIGNHDLNRYGSGAARIAEELSCRGAHMLWNRSERVAVHGVELTITGVADPYTGRARPRLAMEGTAGPRLLLGHAPSIAEHLEPGEAALVLAGHTHGGQIRFSPFNCLTPLDSTWYLDRLARRPAQRYLRGFHWVNGALLYVSHGIGTTRLPLRFLAPPEVVILELVAQPPHPEEPCDSAARYVEELPGSIHRGG